MHDQMKPMPLITVVTVAYNSEKYIKTAIDSVLAQDYQNIEYIILDDASKDATWDIISGYSDSRIKAIRQPENIGEYSNRNKALELSTGKYLIFIDGDDFIYPHAISFFTKMMEAFPAAGMAISRNYENNMIYPVELNPEQTISTHFFTRSILAVSFVSTFFKTQVLREVGGLSRSYRTGDEYIRLLIGSKHNTLFVNYGLTWHRETPGQATIMVSESGIGIAEEWGIFQEFKQKGLFPLPEDSLRLKELQIKKRLARFLLRSLIKGEFEKYQKITRKINFGITDLMYAFKGLEPGYGYLSQFTSQNPLELSLDKNPFSRNYSENAGNC